jgi:putative protease
MKKNPELLAPAGSPEALFAAFQYGADGVYLGVGKLNARASAHNFTKEELEPLLNFAHLNNKKIYAALNTLVKTSELDNAFQTLSDLEKIKIDAVIIHDLGIYKIIKEYFSKLPVHFSTQMTIHNFQGVQKAQEMGAKRVILARELTLKELEHIRKNTSIELEVFVHGARCYSYSGLCLFSSMVGGRSGNRGYCAQPCRKNYTSGNKSGYFFSMCDFFTLKDIPKLKDIGIDAFKIEGRLKTPLYVAYTSSIYKKAINNEPIDDVEAEKTLKTIYSREMQSFPKNSFGETTTDPSFPRHLGLYIGSVSECEIDHTEEETSWITFTTKETLEKFDGIAIVEPGKNYPIGCSVREILVNDKNTFHADQYTQVKIKIPHIVKKGSQIYINSKSSLLGIYQVKTPKTEQAKTHISLTINVQENQILLESASFEKSYPVTMAQSKTQGFNQELAFKYFSRLGDTPFELTEIHLYAPENIYIPPKELNQIRRDFFNELENHVQSTGKKIQIDKKLEYTNIGIEITEPRFTIKIDNPDYIEITAPDADRLILEMSDKILNNLKGTLEIIQRLSNVTNSLTGKTIIFSLPPIIKQEYIPIYQQNIEHLISVGYKNFQVANLGGLELLRKKDVTLTADFPLYIFNPLSIMTLNKQGIKEGTISPELNKKELEQLIPFIKNTCDVILYSDLPCFYSNNCIYASIEEKCQGKTTCNFKEISLKNQEGDILLAENNLCQTILINKNAFSWSHNLKHFESLGQKFFRMDFLYKNYTSAQIQEIVKNTKAGERIINTNEWNLSRTIF